MGALGRGDRRRDPQAVANAINALGERIVEATASEIEDQTGQNDVRPLIDVREASANNLSWEMDASDAAPAGTDWGRDWTETSDHTFDDNKLFNIVSDYEDHCEVCAKIIEEGPYSAAEINEMSLKWAHWHPPPTVVGERSNLIHPNCRCRAVAWKSTRRLPVSMGPRGTGGTKMMTAEQIGKEIADALIALIKSKKGPLG